MSFYRGTSESARRQVRHKWMRETIDKQKAMSTETKELDIEQLFPWSKAKRVNTVQGARDLRTAEIPEGHLFWKYWRADKEKLKAVGLSCKCNPKGVWEACWWIPVGKEEVKAKNEAIQASWATDTDIHVPAPAGLEYYGFQKAGVAFALETFKRGHGCLIADDQGLGKSIQAVGVINSDSKIQRVLVICPATLKINWYRELSKWLTRKMSVGIAEGKMFPRTDIVIINFHILHNFPKTLSFYWDLIVIDEVHFLRNPKSRMAKCVFGYKPTKKEKEKGETGKTGLNARRKLELTGTPISNRTSEVFPLINFLDPKKWNSFFKFGLRYCNGHEGQWGWDFTGSSNLEELQRELRSHCMIRRLKKDVLKDLPPKQHQLIELDPSGCESVVRAELNAWGDDDAFEEAEAEIALAAVDGNEEAYRTAVKKLRNGKKARFEEMSDLRHRTAVAKVPKVIEYIDEQIESTESKKILIFAHHLDVIARLQEHYPKSVTVMGGMSGEEKQQAVDAFQKDPECGPFIGGLTAAGVGLTLTAAHLVIFAELDWVPGNMAQCADRAHRIGQKDCVLVHWLVLQGSLDARQAKTLIKKVEVIDRALDTGNIELEEPAIGKNSIMVGTIKQIKAEAAAMKFTAQQKSAILMGLQIVAGVCNGARDWDGQGFSKFDTTIGKSLAMRSSLSDAQAIVGLKLCGKYKRQIGEEIVAQAKGE